MKKELNYLALKRWKKLGVKNCAQLPVNKKSTPGLTTEIEKCMFSGSDFMFN
jgi:hypothetical protein